MHKKDSRAADNTKAKPPAQAPPRVRDRIFEAASRLFYEHGIRAVGVDAIVQAADTNKMSFYRNYASKEELVAQYLRAQAAEYFRWWDETVAEYKGQPRRQIEALFDAFAQHARDYCPRGCALANAAVEFGEHDTLVSQIVSEHKAESRRRLRKLAREMQARDPDVLGDALMLLMEGGYSTRVATPGESGPMCAAAAAARALIQAHTAGSSKR